MNSKPAPSAYRDHELLSASPGQLVVITYDALLASLTRARVGCSMNSFEVTLPAIERARALLAELLGSLDRERGGALAMQLASIYAFLLGELQGMGTHPDAARLDRHVRMVSELREAFATVASPARANVA
ncbi:MAG: flagellar protein FliS [Gemmatimonadetes bacterium]|nr:flagellar protein FliS [Gemmatimonadota bacterium]